MYARVVPASSDVIIGRVSHEMMNSIINRMFLWAGKIPMLVMFYFQKRST
jgi:hypothetical protein